MRIRIAVGGIALALLVCLSMIGCAKKAREMSVRSAYFGGSAAAPPAPEGAMKGAAMPSYSAPAGMPAEKAPVAAELMTPQAAPAPGVGGAVYPVPEQKALQVAVSQRKLISKAWRTIKVKDVAEGYDKAVKIAAEAGGFVESSSMEKGTEEKERRAELTLRVPADSLDKFMDEVKKLGEVLSTRMQGEDVTEQWADLDARIKNLRWEEDQLLNIMKEKAKTLEDLLRMEREVARLRGEIEQNEGRMTLLRDQVSLATLYLTLVEKGVAVEPVPSGSWALRGTFTHALRAALTGARSVVDFFIWFGLLGILWVPGLLVIILVGRYAVKRVQMALPKSAARADDPDETSNTAR